MKKTDTFLITGLHRSGTTYVGRILSLADSIVVLHEPFNPVFGLEYAPPTYFYLSGNCSDSNIEEIIYKVKAYYGNFSKPAANNNRLLYKMIFSILGGKQHVKWHTLKIRNFFKILPEYIAWKDPFCTFMIDYFTRIQKMKSMVMVRHPCAHYYSVKKQNWYFDIDHITRQKKLINDFGTGIPKDYWEKAKNDNLLTSTALLWKLMSRLVTSANEANDNLLIVRHEDLCKDPTVEIDRICNHFGLKFSLPMQKYIKITSTSSSAEASTGQVHGLNRDSKALINIWRENLSQDQQKALLQVVGDDIRPFYG